MRILVKARVVYANGYQNADTLLIENKKIIWIGQRSSSLNLNFDHVVDISDHFLAPGFVDAHVHLSATGANLTGLNLVSARSAQQAIGLVKDYLQKNQENFIIGHGWDDTDWPDKHLWELSTISELLDNRNLYLSRVDAHSALVKTPVISGIVLKEAHHEVRKFVQDSMTADQRRNQIESALKLAASQGIVSVHENGGPAVSGDADFKDVMSFAGNFDLPLIYGYWGSTNLSDVKNLNAYGAAGDLTVDGSIGSMTAALNEPYINSENFGTSFLTSSQIAEHLINCTKAEIQGGFHAIGDGALDAVITGFKEAEKVCGAGALRSIRHRIEHAEMLDMNYLDYLSSIGVTLSMQPVFDELWGDQNGLYEQRLGIQRSHQMNTFAKILKSGTNLAFGSDSPVTPLNPWRTIKAAMNHHISEHQISGRAAFAAHTRGGWRAVNQDDSGAIEIGAPAHLAAWEVNEYLVKIPDERVRAWSTDIRSGTPVLPDLSKDIPKCLLTIRDGKAIFDPENLWPDV